MGKKIGTLIKVITSKRNINESTQYDSLLLIYRDEQGNKKTRFIDRAEVPYYIIKDKESVEAMSPPMFIEKSKLTKNTTFSDLLYREIATKTDSLHYYDRALTTWGSDSYAMKNLFKHNWLYDTDMDFADRYIAKFHEEFEPDESYKLHKCYFDIEVDIMPNGWKKDSKGNIGYMGFPDEEIAPVPLNITTLYDEKAKNLYTFVVRNVNNKSITDFETNIDKFESNMVKKLLEEDFVMINDMIFYFFDTELEAIEAFFKKIHEIDPDFMLAWNAGFDIQTIQNRLKRLYSRSVEENKSGSYERMITTMCDIKYTVQKDSQGQTAYIPAKAYYKAKKHLSFVNRIDEFQVIDGINWMDQMLYYANVRKVQGQKESYSLDAIANEELDKEKLEFEPGETIKTLPWTNFTKFAEYNIRDVILLHLIEDKNLDMDMVQRLSEITNTRKEKVFSKTVSLKNFVNKFAHDSGFVMNNNKNATYGEDSFYYEKNFMNKNVLIEHEEIYKHLFETNENFGAYVADPNQNLPDNGIMLNGKKSNFLFENVFDEDFASLYPSIIRAYNLDKNTQVGKFFLVDDKIKQSLLNDYNYTDLFPVSKNEAAAEGDGTTPDLGPTLVDSLMSFDFIRIGKKYFDLPSTEDLIEEIEKTKNRE